MVICCVGNVNRIIPNYVSHMWMATEDNGLAAALYGPCKVSALAGDRVPVEIACRTNYPFEETIQIEVAPAQAARFPLYFRIPAWCENPEIKVNRSAVDVRQAANGFVRIERPWSRGDIVKLRLPMPVRIERGYETEYPKAKYWWRKAAVFDHRRLPYASVCYGPLLMALPIADKDPNTPRPDAKWNYALDNDGTEPGVDVRVVRRPMPKHWDWPLDAPVTLTIPARAFDWHPSDHQALPDAPVEGTQPETIRLVPYGCTKFRISMFPVTPRAWAATAAAVLRLPAVFGDNMVLQQGQPVPIWGWADKGEEVTVSVAGQTRTAIAGEDGRWKIVLDKLDVGQPLTISIKGSSGNAITLKNVLVGEVWVCSGQSNMELRVADCKDAQREIAAADYPKIRLFNVVKKPAAAPETDCVGDWKECSPATVPNFSAAAYYFGRQLHRDLGVPIGLIETAWGGTPAEFWTSRKTLEANPALRPLAGQGQSSQLYNGMIAPLIPYAIRGAIWYQGESNVSRAMQYHTLFPAMIANWRADWGQGDFPFGFVQIAPFRYQGQNPACAAELWEAQLLTLKSVPNTGMVVTTDIGDVKDIHPKNKQEVGRRLALWALAKVHGRRLVYSGPIYRSMSVEGGAIRLRFYHAAGGLAASDGKPLREFTIAGADGKFVPAAATIDGDTVVVRSDQVSQPVAVRYAWRDDATPNLANKEGLPASPFRTDVWEAVFSNKQYQPRPLPTFADAKDRLPSPVYDENPLYVQMYWKTWQLAFRNFHEPKPKSGFVSQFIDASFNENIFLWDTCFLTMFCNYGHPWVPGIASLDNFYAKQHEDGEICREIVRTTGKDFAPWTAQERPILASNSGGYTVTYVNRTPPQPPPRLTLDGLNHPILAWAELDSVRVTGDRARLKIVYEPLVRYYRALQKYLRQGNGLYMTDWASMDNSPRNQYLLKGGTAVEHVLRNGPLRRKSGHDRRPAAKESGSPCVSPRRRRLGPPHQPTHVELRSPILFRPDVGGKTGAGQDDRRLLDAAGRGGLDGPGRRFGRGTAESQQLRPQASRADGACRSSGLRSGGRLLAGRRLDADQYYGCPRPRTLRQT